MSNVLIGVIGVILFIGLALAGALFLGPRFSESRTASISAAAVQIVSQVTSAARMYQTENGETVDSNPVGTVLATTSENPYRQLVSGGYLRTVPKNPIKVGSGEVYLTDILGRPFVILPVGSNDGDLVCRYANRRMGNGDTVDVPLDSPGRSWGCGRTTPTSSTYILWERV